MNLPKVAERIVEKMAEQEQDEEMVLALVEKEKVEEEEEEEGNGHNLDNQLNFFVLSVQYPRRRLLI